MACFFWGGGEKSLSDWDPQKYLAVYNFSGISILVTVCSVSTQVLRRGFLKCRVLSSDLELGA